MLQNKYNCDVQINQNPSHELQGIYIHGDKMKKVFNAYPEVLFADSTYKLVDLDLPIFVLMVQDGNGQSHIISLGLLVREDKETLKWFLEIFLEKNPAHNKTMVVVTDKDLTKKAVIRKLLPNISLRICKFHSLRTFNREITCDKLGITPAGRDFAKSLFEAKCFTETEEKYMEFYGSVKTLPKTVVEYFEEN